MKIITAKQRKKISDTMKRKGIQPPHSADISKKISKAMQGNTHSKGRILSAEHKRKIGEGNRKAPHRSGKDHPCWKGGVTPANHKRCQTPEWKLIRNRIYKRDNWTCQICGKHCQDDIQCHHIVPYRITQDNSDGNLITLCKSCHCREESKYYTMLGQVQCSRR